MSSLHIGHSLVMIHRSSARPRAGSRRRRCLDNPRRRSLSLAVRAPDSAAHAFVPLATRRSPRGSSGRSGPRLFRRRGGHRFSRPRRRGRAHAPRVRRRRRQPGIDLPLDLQRGSALRGGDVSVQLPVRRTCERCGGRGEAWDEPCAPCAGAGHTEETRDDHDRPAARPDRRRPPAGAARRPPRRTDRRHPARHAHVIEPSRAWLAFLSLASAWAAAVAGWRLPLRRSVRHRRVEPRAGCGMLAGWLGAPAGGGARPTPRRLPPSPASWPSHGRSPGPTTFPR